MSKAFETDKHGYRIRDVEAYMAETKAQTASLKDRIAELRKELEEKDAELRAFKQKQELIVKSIVSAAEKAEQIEQLIKHKFAAEMSHLDAFHRQWLDYYKRLIEAYPLSDQLRPLGEFNRRMTAILTGDESPRRKIVEAEAQFRRENERLAREDGIRESAGEDDYFGDESEAQNGQVYGGSNGTQKTQDGGQSESQAQKKKYIGFIPVGEGSGEFDGSYDLEDFDPEESIRQMLRRQANDDPEYAAQKTAGTKSSRPDKSAKTAPKNNSKASKTSGKSVKNNAANSAKHGQKNGAGNNGNKSGSGYKSPVAATVSPQALGSSDSGFSFEEALNPTQDLSDILKEIGLKFGEDK